jgi:hypothetical protein
MGSAEALSLAVNEVFMLLNLDRFLRHVPVCKDPMCGAVISIDGSCKVFREICGADVSNADESAEVAKASDVHASFAHGAYRKKVCGNMHGRKPGMKGKCNECFKKGSTVSGIALSSTSRSCLQASTRQLRSAAALEDQPDGDTSASESSQDEELSDDDQETFSTVWL